MTRVWLRLPAPERDEPLASVEELVSEPPAEQRRRSLVGWLVDVEEF